jgi:chondroitin AC lyase
MYTAKQYCLMVFFLLFGLMAKGGIIDDLRMNATEAFLAKISSSSEITTARNFAIQKAGDLIPGSNNTGTWSDINLSDLDDKDCDSNNQDTKWQPKDHLENIRKMAEGLKFFNPNTEATTIAAIELAIVRALRAWYLLALPNPNTIFCPNCPGSSGGTAPPSLPYCCDNWWWNQIGKQYELQRIGILFWDDLKADHDAGNLVNGFTLLNHHINNLPATVLNSNTSDPNDEHTGANRADLASSMIIKGILLGGIDETAGLVHIQNGSTKMGEALDYGAVEGLRPDNSFHQHGSLLYTGGYGLSFVESISICGAILRGTPYIFSLERRTRFYNFILEGYRRMLRSYTTDYSAVGRIISDEQEPHSLKVSSAFLNLTKEIIETQGDDDAQESLADALTYIHQHDDDDPDDIQDITAVGGSKHFWKSDYVVHQQTAYLTSVKMCSSRTIGTESINRQNLRGYWLPYGCTFIYRIGREYENIFPYWDWAKIPGVTNPDIWLTPEDSDEPESTTQLSAFVGAADNNQYSVSAMELNKNYDRNNDPAPNQVNIKNIKAKKSWFHFGTEIIALGAGINSNDADPILTTINQSRRTGVVTRDGIAVANETSGAAATTWIHHDGTAYMFPPNTSVHLSTLTQTGAWTNIDGGGSQGIEDGPVFKAWLNHGTTPTAASNFYSYRIVPGIATNPIADVATEVTAYMGSNPIEILKNEKLGVDASSRYIQAVKKGDLVGIVYYPMETPNTTFTPTLIPVGDGIQFSTNHPCALLYDRATGNICISSPDRLHTSIDLTITTPDGSVVITFTLPMGEEQGKSTCQTVFNATLAGNIISHCDPTSTGRIAGVQINPYGTATNAMGDYSIPVIPSGNYVLTPFKNNNPMNGLTTFDALLVQRHILAIEILNPFEKIAADANNTGTITTFDALIIRSVALGNTTAFPNNTSWRFVRENHVFDTSTPLAIVPPFPESIQGNLNVINGSPDFFGIKIGDVNCSATNGFQPPCQEEVKILVEDKALTTNEIFTVALRVENFDNMEAYQFGLDFKSDKLQYLGIQSGDLNKGSKIENFGLAAASVGRIRTSWLYNEASNPAFTVTDTTLSDGASLFKVQFKALDNVASLATLLKLNDEDFRNPSAWSDGNNCAHPITLEFMPAGWSGGRDDSESTSPVLTTNIRVHPNPTSGELVFQISTQAEAENTISIFNPMGQEMLRQTVYLQEGQNTIQMKNISDWQDGLYFYSISDSSGIYGNGKFVKN